MSNLEGKIENLCDKMDTLIDQNKGIIRFLIIVLSIIALGRTGWDIAKDFINNPASAQIQQEAPK